MLAMTESDERLDALSDKIEQAEKAAKSLSEQDVIDPDSVEGEQPDTVEQATGRAPVENDDPSTERP
jgi:hypothetical protein